MSGHEVDVVGERLILYILNLKASFLLVKMSIYFPSR